MTPFRVFASFALAAGLFLAAGSSVAQRGVQPNGGPQPPKLVPIRPGLGQPPPGQHIIIGGELPLVPKSSAAFVSVKVSALVDHPDLKPVLEQLRKTPDALDGFVEAFGLMPHEIDRVTLFWPTLGDRNWFGSPVLVLTTRDAYNEARLLKSLNAEAVFSDNPRGRFPQGAGGPRWSAEPASKVKLAKDPVIPTTKIEPPPKPPEEGECSATAETSEAGDPLFYELRRGPFSLLFLIDDHTLVFLPEDFGSGTTHLALLGQLLQKKSTGPLADAIAAAGGHTIAAGIHLPPILRGSSTRRPRNWPPMRLSSRPAPAL